MPRVSIDTNIIIYALGHDGDARATIARDLLRRAAKTNGVLTQQVIGEFLNVGRKSRHLDQTKVRNLASDISIAFPVLVTTLAMGFAAFDLSHRHMLQFWDALILTVCAANDVTILLTADMQDGQTIGGVTLLDPFRPENEGRLAGLFA